jgi:large subunit ribosomal protein L1
MDETVELAIQLNLDPRKPGQYVMDVSSVWQYLLIIQHWQLPRTLATSDMTSQLSSIARLLGPRGLMPNPKIGTIVPPDKLLAALADRMSGVSNYEKRV